VPGNSSSLFSAGLLGEDIDLMRVGILKLSLRRWKELVFACFIFGFLIGEFNAIFVAGAAVEM
jgi:hypothetical protein